MTLAIAAQNTYSDNTGSVNPHPVNLPTGITAGDLLLIFFAGNGTLSITGPSGWTQLLDKTNTDRYVIYGKIADGTEGSTADFSRLSAVRAAAVSYRITGARNGLTTSEIAISTAVDASTATPDPPSLTPSWGSAENYWIAVTFSADGGYTFSSYPTNYADGQNNVQVGTGTGTGLSVAAYLLTASSEDPGVFTTVTAKTRSTYTLAIRPNDTVTLSLAPTEAADTAAIALTATHTASLAATEAPDVAAVTLTAAHTASIAVTESPDTASLNVLVGDVVTADLAATEAPDTASIAVGSATDAPITGGGYYREHKPQYRIHPEYEDAPRKTKRRKPEQGEQPFIIAPEPIVRKLGEIRPAWNTAAELMRSELEAAQAAKARAERIKAIVQADDDWLLNVA